MNMKQITPHIAELRIPFSDVFTKVFLVKTPSGNLLFDTATYPTDVRDIILPALAAEGIFPAALSCVFISHTHCDHAGGLCELLAHCPDITVIAGSTASR